MHGADCIRLRFRMSFGERDKRRNKEFSGLPGGNSEREPPDPIPNSEVKTFCADGSVAASHARVGHCQASHAKAPMLERTSGPFLLAYMLPAIAGCDAGGSIEVLPMVATGFLRLATNPKVFVTPMPIMPFAKKRLKYAAQR